MQLSQRVEADLPDQRGVQASSLDVCTRVRGPPEVAPRRAVLRG